MSFRSKLFLMETGKAPNTFIGGVSASLSTPALLATKLGISAGNISNFSVIGSNIQCHISVSYVANFVSDTSITYYKDIDGLVTDFQFNGCVNFNGEVIFKGVITMISNSVTRYTPINLVELKNVVNIPNNGFYSGDSPIIPVTFYIPNCTSLGSSSGSNLVFYGIASGSIIYTNPYLQTNNSGAPDGDLAYAESRGAIIIYVTNFTAPSQITTLSATTIYKNAIKLGWTAPSSVNAIDYYEVYIDGVLYPNKFTTNYALIAGLTYLSNHDFTVIAVDVFYNKSVFSNVLNEDIDGTAYPFQGDIISYYKLNSNILDSVGSNNGAGTSIAYGTGKVGDCAILNGSSSYASIPDANNLSFTSGSGVDLPFSISMWLNFNSTSNSFILNKRSNTSTGSEYQIVYLSGKIAVYLLKTDSTAFLFREYSFVPNAGVWYNLIATYDASKTSSGLKLYLNATLVGASSMTGTYAGMTNTASDLVLGKRGWMSGDYFNGKIDETVIFNRELNAAEVSDIYNIGNTGNPLT